MYFLLLLFLFCLRDEFLCASRALPEMSKLLDEDGWTRVAHKKRKGKRLVNEESCIVEKYQRTIIPCHALNQCRSILNGIHKEHCGYYALWFAFCFNKAKNIRHVNDLIFERTSEQDSNFQEMLCLWEQLVRNYRGKKRVSSSPNDYNYLYSSELRYL